VLEAEGDGTVIGIKCLAMPDVPVDAVSLPLAAGSSACAMLRPFAADLVDLNSVVKRLRDGPQSLPSRSISTSATDPGRRVARAAALVD